MDGVTLRPYQLDRVAAAYRQLADGRNAAIVLPTGTGKTLTALAVLDRVLSAPWARAGRVLWLVDIKALIDQTIDAGDRAGVAVEARTIQSIRRAPPRADGTRAPAIPPGEFDAIVLDECHKFLTELRTELIRGARTPLLGLTATPRRGDGRHISELFPDGYVCGPYTLGEAIADGFLADCEVLRVDLADLDLWSVKRTGADFDKEHLARVMNVPAHNQEIVRRWRSVAVGRDGAIMRSNFFAVDTAHADALAAEVNRQVGEPVCEAIHSNRHDAHAAIKRFRAGEFPVAASVMMVAEGFDYPALRCGVLARPTRSERLLVQMLGRFLRLHESKPRAVLLDCSGGYERLDLARIYDVVAPHGVEEPTLTEGAGGPGDDCDDAIPLLSEVISRVRTIDLFRRRCKAARTLPWHRVDLTVNPNSEDFARELPAYVLPLADGWLVVSANREDPGSAAAAFLYYCGHRAQCEALVRADAEPATFRYVEAWARARYFADSWLGRSRADALKAANWFRDRQPATEKQRSKLAEGKVDAPPGMRRGEAQAVIRRLFATGELA